MYALYLYQCQYPEGSNLHNKNFKIFFKFLQELIFMKKPTSKILEELILMNFSRKIFYLLLYFSYVIEKGIYKVNLRLDSHDSKVLNIYGN